MLTNEFVNSRLVGTNGKNGVPFFSIKALDVDIDVDRSRVLPHLRELHVRQRHEHLLPRGVEGIRRVLLRLVDHPDLLAVEDAPGTPDALCPGPPKAN